MRRILSTLAVMLIAASAMAMSFSKARREAYFLTDKMAYELGLSDEQMEVVYEINFDYLRSLYTYADVEGPAWWQRREDLHFVLTPWQWNLFIATPDFFVPVRWVRRHSFDLLLRSRYFTASLYYYPRPMVYGSYRGGHNHGNYYTHLDIFRPAPPPPSGHNAREPHSTTRIQPTNHPVNPNYGQPHAGNQPQLNGGHQPQPNGTAGQGNGWSIDTGNSNSNNTRTLTTDGRGRSGRSSTTVSASTYYGTTSQPAAGSTTSQPAAGSSVTPSATAPAPRSNNTATAGRSSTTSRSSSTATSGRSSTTSRSSSTATSGRSSSTTSRSSSTATAWRSSTTSRSNNTATSERSSITSRSSSTATSGRSSTTSRTTPSTSTRSGSSSSTPRRGGR